MGAWSSGQWRDRARLGERCNQERTSEFIRMGENGGKTDVAVATSGMITSEGTAAGRTNSDCAHTGVIRHPSKLPTAEAELGQTSGAVVGGSDIRDETTSTSGITTNEGTEAGRTNSDCTHTGVIRHPSKLPTAEAELGQTSGAVVGGRDIRDGTDVGDKRGDAWGRGMKDRVDGICGGFSAGRLRETN